MARHTWLYVLMGGVLQDCNAASSSPSPLYEKPRNAVATSYFGSRLNARFKASIAFRYWWSKYSAKPNVACEWALIGSRATARCALVTADLVRPTKARGSTER